MVLINRNRCAIIVWTTTLVLLYGFMFFGRGTFPEFAKLKTRHAKWSSSSGSDVDIPSSSPEKGTRTATSAIPALLSSTYEGPNIAFIFAGSLRSFVCPQVHWTIRSHVIDALGGNAHVFVRYAEEDNFNSRTGNGTQYSPTYYPNEAEETLKVLNPRVMERFSFATEVAEMKKQYPGTLHSLYRANDQRRYSMYFQRAMGYKLVTSYEDKYRMRFDWVVLIRLDTIWLEPVLPIASYSNDRVWVTETGYVPFNDQFMLIPREFSDYIYDLNTKVSGHNVYCIGGPDVELWKCNATELRARKISNLIINDTLKVCCDAMDGGHGRSGYSEHINFRHFLAGKIPVGIGYFPMLLTRIHSNGRQRCHPECERLLMNSKKEYSLFGTALYPYFKNITWPDSRGRAVSIGDHSLCYILTKSSFSPWTPSSACNIASSISSTNNTTSGLDTRYCIVDSDHSAAAIDFTRSLEKQMPLTSHLFPSPRHLELWRIHPSWNVDGCLTFSFINKTHFWGECVDRSKKKGGLRHHAAQLFYLTVFRNHPFYSTNPEAEAARKHAFVLTNLTRVMIPDRTSVTWEFLDMRCMTVSKLELEASISFEVCSHDREIAVRQEFLPAEGALTGSSSRSTIANLHVAAQPTWCVMRSKDKLTETSFVNVDDSLVLNLCRFEGRYARMGFEFELVERFA